MTRPGTLGELRASGWESRPVKDEVRANALARIAAGKPLVDGVIGFDDTVLPQLENALLAGPAEQSPVRRPLSAERGRRRDLAGAGTAQSASPPGRPRARVRRTEGGGGAQSNGGHRGRRPGDTLTTGGSERLRPPVAC